MGRKTTITSLFLLVAGTTILFLRCGDQDDTQGSRGSADVEALSGTWTSGCLKVAIQAILSRLVIFVMALGMLTACGHHRRNGEPQALPDGVYDWSAPVCVSTGVAPLYPDVAHKAHFFAFETLIEHTLTLGHDAKRTLKDADCVATVDTGIFRNFNSGFSLRLNQTTTFVPEGCALTVQAKDIILSISKANGAPFTDSADMAEDLPFDVATVEGGFDLTTRDVIGLSDLWAAYGCAQPDRLRVHLTGPK